MPPFKFNNSNLDPRVSPVRRAPSGGGGGFQPGGPGTNIVLPVPSGTPARINFYGNGGIYYWDFVQDFPGPLIGYWHPAGPGTYTDVQLTTDGIAAGASATGYNGIGSQGVRSISSGWDVPIDTFTWYHFNSVTATVGPHIRRRIIPSGDAFGEFDLLLVAS